jgi:hypothetical protein
MIENIDDFFEDTETVKSLRFFLFFWLKKPSAQKYRPYKTFAKFELAYHFASGLRSVKHV